MRETIIKSRNHRAFQSRGTSGSPLKKYIIIKLENYQDKERIFKAEERNRKEHTKNPQEASLLTYQQKFYQQENLDKNYTKL